MDVSKSSNSRAATFEDVVSQSTIEKGANL